jgi:DNA ligase-1
VEREYLYLESDDVTGVQAEEIMKHTYSVLPIYEQIIDAVLKFGICKLSEVCSFKLSEVLNKFQDMDFTCEYKYDGERAQVLLIFPPLMFLL